MSLRESPFPNGFAEALHTVGWGLVFPCFWFLDRLIAVCISTSLERHRRREEECYLHPLQVFFGFILFLFLFLISTPFAFLGFLLWAPLQLTRRPFSYRHQVATVEMENRNVGWEEAGRVTFGFVTANLCLLPDGLARFNNLGHSQNRALAIGQSIVQGVNRPHIRILIDSPSSSGTLSPSISLLPQSASTSYGATDAQVQPGTAEQSADTVLDGAIPKTSTGGASVNVASDHMNQQQPAKWNCNQNSNQQGSRGRRNPPRALRTLGKAGDTPLEVSMLFPANVDIVCLEEVFDKRAAKKLTEALGTVFSHILYDIGVYACQPCGTCSSFKFFNSGLFLASRFPVMEAQYHCFPNGRGEDALASKGLLCAKLQIGLQKGEKKMVGFFNCTHLHAPERDGEIRSEQLDMVTQWITEFQTMTRQQDEVVVFDVLCGDFNFDNCSPDDRLEQNHSLFNDYRDPCRAGPGKEKPWVIGTLLQQPTLYDENVKTPDNLQRTLEDEELRKVYLAPPVSQGSEPLVYPEPGEPWVGRRLDYLLYRESTLTDHCRTEVEEFTYVTQLAGLTDHIPVGLRLNVTL
ncbi:sphingomyelin phosphodiesterase 5 [Colossoma macropomum]|uniref:sphingomyelin phosphodiesterase 5 n=1 Tax=Colossoma macropomum TaxID=42526 RepID=UPI0018645D05|nr:sphingomyelin phosphodiesterase 5 [Colossoma macropomum]